MSSDKFRSQWSKATQNGNSRCELVGNGIMQTSGALRYSTIPVSEANVEIHENP